MSVHVHSCQWWIACCPLSLDKGEHMTSDNVSAHHDRLALWILLIVVAITAAVFFWTRANYHQGDAAIATQVDAAGHLHVLGITLGKTSLKQAELILKSQSDVALYIYPQGNPKAGLKLEAFFPAIADHTKVILLLDVVGKGLKSIESHATIPHLYPNQVARMNLAAEDFTIVHDATVAELTLIPNLNISSDTLKARFGTPDQILKIDQDRNRYIYKAIGLDAVVSKKEPPVLHFINPNTAGKNEPQRHQGTK